MSLFHLGKNLFLNEKLFQMIFSLENPANAPKKGHKVGLFPDTL